MDYNIDLHTGTDYQEVREYKGGKQIDIQKILQQKKGREEDIRKYLLDNLEGGDKFSNYTISEFDSVFYMFAPKGKEPTMVLTKTNNGDLVPLYDINLIKDYMEGTFQLYTTAKKVILKKEPEPFILDDTGKRIKINEQYYKYWNDVAFYVSVGWIKGIINNKPKNRGKVKIEEEDLKADLISGTIKPKDMLEFKAYGELSEELFNKYLPQAIEGLLKQTGDLRFSQKGNGESLEGLEVTKKELDFYLENELITKSYYKQCIDVLIKREKLLNSKKDINEKTSGGIGIEKVKKGVLDRISDLLGWD